MNLRTLDREVAVSTIQILLEEYLRRLRLLDEDEEVVEIQWDKVQNRTLPVKFKLKREEVEVINHI